MKKDKLVLMSFVHAAAVVGYVALIGYLMPAIGNRLSGPQMLGFMAALLVFVFSAAVMAVLVFGRPAYLFLNGEKKSAILFLAYTMGWMLLMIIVILAIFLAFAQPIVHISQPL